MKWNSNPPNFPSTNEQLSSDSQSGGVGMPEPYSGYNHQARYPSHRPDLLPPSRRSSYEVPIGFCPARGSYSELPTDPPPIHYGSHTSPTSSHRIPGDNLPGQQYDRQQRQPTLELKRSYSSIGNQYLRQRSPSPPLVDYRNHSTQDSEGVLDLCSLCMVKKKALCIGINYFGQDAELRGCINDANNMRRFLRSSHYGFKDEDTVVLTDDSTSPLMMPTKENMLQAMQWLVRGASPHDSLFFHYSGHGGQTKDLDGDEVDGHDEVIYPMDFKENGHIIDDLMHQIMVKPLPAGCRLTAIFDSCHSGTALDLPYVYNSEGDIEEHELASKVGQSVLSAVTSYVRRGVMKATIALGKTGYNRKAEQIARATRSSAADVVSWSGCKDSQTSADSQEGGIAIGAMSHAFITFLSANMHQLTYQQVLVGVRQVLKEKYSQEPQLSCSHPLVILFYSLYYS